MKTYTVRIRKTVISECDVEVFAATAMSAMDFVNSQIDQTILKEVKVIAPAVFSINEKV